LGPRKLSVRYKGKIWAKTNLQKILRNFKKKAPLPI
jgi:hypothetical protein